MPMNSPSKGHHLDENTPAREAKGREGRRLVTAKTTEDTRWNEAFIT